MYSLSGTTSGQLHNYFLIPHWYFLIINYFYSTNVTSFSPYYMCNFSELGAKEPIKYGSHQIIETQKGGNTYTVSNI